MPRKSIGERPMTDAERQARHRAARAAGAPVIRTRHPTDHRGRAQRWHDAVAELTEAQAQYATWLEALPTNLQDSTLAAALQAIYDLDLADSRRSTHREDSAGTDHLPQGLRASNRQPPTRPLAAPSRRNASRPPPGPFGVLH